MRRSAYLALTCVLALTGCAKDDNEETGGEAGTSGDSTGSSGDTGAATESGTSGDATDSGGGVPENEPARGIAVANVEANSGSAIAVVTDGAWVEGSARTAQIPKNRNTAFRVYVDVDDDNWVDRDIEGRFIVTHADGTESVYSETVTVAGDSSEVSLQSNLLFGVLAEDMQPGAQFQIELYEASTDYTSLPEVDGITAAFDSPQFIGIESGYQNMKIVIVPVQYSFGSCNTLFDTSEENLDKYRRAMFQQNPLENIEMEVHAPLVVGDLDLGDSGDFFQLLNRASQLRASDSPAPNVYYYILFDNCGECISAGNTSGGCTLGVAPGLASDSMGAASTRVAIGAQFLGTSEVGIETFVHEVGHNQGRSHVVCPGQNAAGPDITYPHDDGKIGVWGFGVEDFEIRNASTHTDYMSYCNPTWVSDWQWRATFERIRILSSWDEQLVRYPDMEGSAQLVGHVNPETGESSWFTDRGGVDPEARTDPKWSVDFDLGAGKVDHQVANVGHWSEGPWITVRAPLPESFEQLQRIQFHAPTFDLAVDRADIHAYHGRGLATPQ